MKKEYEIPEIKIMWLDRRDVITTSISDTDGPIAENGPIGGGGYDPDGWT